MSEERPWTPEPRHVRGQWRIAGIRAQLDEMPAIGRSRHRGPTPKISAGSYMARRNGRSSGRGRACTGAGAPGGWDPLMLSLSEARGGVFRRAARRRNAGRTGAVAGRATAASGGPGRDSFAPNDEWIGARYGTCLRSCGAPRGSRAPGLLRPRWLAANSHDSAGPISNAAMVSVSCSSRRQPSG